MPVTRELSRTAAALGTALALIFLPFAGTIAPANASLTDSNQTSSSSSGGETSDPDGSPESSDALDPGEMTDPVTADSNSESSGTDATAGDEDADPDNEADTDGGKDDPACDEPSDGGDNSAPCEVKEPIDSTWNQTEQTMQVSSMPKSWAGKNFSGPVEKDEGKRWPTQSSSTSADDSDSGADGAEPDSATDDSGNPVPKATNDAPSKYSFDEGGYVLNADTGERMVFTEFKEAPNPDWTFVSDGTDITVKDGEPYPPPSDEADSDASSNSSNDADSGDMAGDDAKATGDNNDTASADDANAKTSSGSDGNEANSNSSSDDKANSTSSSESESSSDTSSDSESSDSAKADSKDADASSSSDADSAKKNSDSKSSSSSDGSDSGNSDSVGDAGNDGSSNKDGGKDDKGSADKNGSGTISGDGGPVGDDTTPDPETGNGSSDTRDEIPGDVGDDWMPGNGDSPPPDYSDPVPQNPDTPVPDDDKDLITGGETPKPRADKPPTTSFGESIVSTIVSSWPIFILAASGMAAVGFIIWLVGRRNNQN